MKRFTVEVSDETAATLKDLAKLCTEASKDPDGFTTHGALTVSGLLAMLAEDAAMVLSRPGSWEGSGMAGQLASHGYEV